MTLDRTDTLLALLRRVELLAPEQVDEIARELVPHYPDALRLGEYLVRIDWLTPYQLQLLLAGQWAELTIGPYQILDRLGEGGVSEVFKAWDTKRGRIVALKVLRQDLTVKDEAVRQFQREFKAITRLSHPNVIKTFDAGQEGGMHYFAMECVEGMDLERFVAQVGPLSVEMACDFARQAATGLQHAHQSGLVHRDVKPANLFLLHPPLPGITPAARKTNEPVVKIIDWGLARCVRDPAEGEAAGGRGDPDEQKGALIGTADYVAPEQARDPTLVDIRADVYSLGCTLYHLLTGQPPFPAPSLMQKLLMHQEKEPPSLRAVRDDVPEELDAIVRKMLAKNPADRYQIPLLVVTPLRRFCMTDLRAAANGTGYRPGSSPVLGPSSSPTLQRPGSGSNLPRPPAPGTAINLPRPSTQSHLNRPGENGTTK
jgi:eukaryotic-like serine/threonine-protein kinase